MHDLVEDLYRAHAVALTAALALSTGDREAAEDLAHEVFVLALRREEHLRQHPDPRAWLFRTAYHLANGRWRLAFRRRHKVARSHPVVSDHWWADVADLRDSLQRLSRKQRDAIVLHCYLGFDLQETADLLGCAPGSAKTHLHRGRNTLNDLLGTKEATR